MADRKVLDLESLFSLKGKVALVTGGSRGIGYMIAQGLLQAGAKVYISSRKKINVNKRQASFQVTATVLQSPPMLRMLKGERAYG